ncbi:hypothetical protein QFZ34_002106 [Phyllobacterium ifriqiyense]|uniref:DUF968 domain-containing protein n=1 Tax=Phyllobacterium ifriqiyense TaxID=314238 RepID=A0ABU0S862_9HYPH|nr:DUF968 domain-containing protein [Phyllobacterium ifriqiyense]MDQ0996924.1 hypothetical protein [Phyllobacterium ifriqiyense]
MAGFRVAREHTAFQMTAPKVSKKPRQKEESHLKFIRTLPCVVTGIRNVEAAHIRYGDISYGKYETGMAEKPHDKWVLPLSPEEHRKQHDMNEREYWTLVGINPLDLAMRLWFNTGDEEACEQIILQARTRP